METRSHYSIPFEKLPVVDSPKPASCMQRILIFDGRPRWRVARRAMVGCRKADKTRRGRRSIDMEFMTPTESCFFGWLFCLDGTQKGNGSEKHLLSFFFSLVKDGAWGQQALLGCRFNGLLSTQQHKNSAPDLNDNDNGNSIISFTYRTILSSLFNFVAFPPIPNICPPSPSRTCSEQPRPRSHTYQDFTCVSPPLSSPPSPFNNQGPSDMAGRRKRVDCPIRVLILHLLALHVGDSIE